MSGFPFELPVGVGREKRKIVGRGRGSGLGKTCGKGNKGQKARSGGSIRPGFEGGQMPLYRRLPKRGFSNARFSKTVAIVNLEQLSKKFDNGDRVDAAALVAKRLIRDGSKWIKVLADGDCSKKLTIAIPLISAAAREKILQAGGEILGESGSS